MEEKSMDTSEIFGIFCNFQNLLEYFSEFHNSLQDEICDLESIDISKFCKCLQYLDRNSFFENTENAKINEFLCVLHKIFDIICLQYFSNNIICPEKFLKGSKITSLFESLALLIKILVTKCNQNVSLKCLLFYIHDYFHKYSPNHENYSHTAESDKEQLQHILKLFLSILRCLNSSIFSSHISSEVFIQILSSFPFSNKYAMNVFINQIVPSLIPIADDIHKKIILELIWKRIVICHEETSDSCKDMHHYSLLCCFSDLMFKEHFELENFSIYDDSIWKIIQSGLMSDNSYVRKQSIYVFKMILFWLKTNNIVITLSCKKVSLFSLCTIKDLVIWNDLVILFEILEEKQIHVIKPLLPKFSRILQSSKTCSTKSFNLHPSWITCFIRRMICHESKFIMKQGIYIAMNINFNEYQIHQLHYEEFIQVLIRGFNDQNMYCRMNENDNLSLYLSSEKIFVFLCKYISAFETELQKGNFLRYLLKLISSESWCGVALLHVTYALTNLNYLPSWKSQDILYIRKIIQGSLKTHESIIRTAVEYLLLKSCILFIDWNTLCFEDIAELLFVFKSLERHTEIWNALVSKLKEIFAAECSNNLSVSKAKEFSLNCINKILTVYSSDQNLSEMDLLKLTKLLIILADSCVISFNLQAKALNWSHLLQPLISVLVDAPKRPYIPQEKFYKVLQFYTFLIDISQGSIKIRNDAHSSAIIKCLTFSTEFIEFIYQKSFVNIKGSDDIIHFHILYNALHTLSSIEGFYELFLKLLPTFIAHYNSLPQNFLPKKILIILFYLISNGHFNDTKCVNKFQSNPLKEFNHTLLLKIVNEHVIDDLSKSVFVNEIEREVWMNISTKSICEFWDTASCTVNHLSSFDEKDLITSLVQQAQNIFAGASKLTYASTINCIQKLIPKLGLENLHVINDLLNSAWKACFELHGSEAYRPAVNSFIEAVFQTYMLNQKCFDILYKYFDCFQDLSENTLGIFYVLIKQFCNVFPLKSLCELNFNYIPILIHSLTYGPIHHKGQKILEDTISYISEHDNHFSNKFKNYNKPSIFVRVTVIIYLLKNLHKNSAKNQKISVEIINNLLVLDDNTRTSKSSKFANSYSHRIRNRIWQAILLLQPNLTTREENENFFKKILDFLEFENQQPSIRYLQEWLLLKILNDYKCFIDDFIYVLENSLEKRPGFVVSLLSVLIHLIIHDFIISENHVHKCFPVLINCCMAQNFAVRLYSRLAINKLFLFSEKKKFLGLTQKYDFLRDILFLQQSENILLEKGNIYKNLLKLQEDFYFSVFHPIRHFTLETIFYDLPRLSNVTCEEWVKPEYFKYQLDSESDFIIPCFNTDKDLKSSTASSWVDKSVEESTVIESDSFDYNFQKKICPSKFENYNKDIDMLVENKPKKNGLIVIASLIDKIPNLGGLCRTCEVFGVDEFVVGSLKYTEDKQFQNLAVSADKWVSIKEVKSHHLKEYLCSLKEEGYTLVGAEQTDDGHKLTDYIFPKKSALLLGHEKEGMPVDLIQLLDACVEIPQQGIIRSLNVHVSGAIFIWEYARQQIKQPT